jgi:hypothetical protein
MEYKAENSSGSNNIVIYLDNMGHTLTTRMCLYSHGFHAMLFFAIFFFPLTFLHTAFSYLTYFLSTLKVTLFPYFMELMTQ